MAVKLERLSSMLKQTSESRFSGGEAPEKLKTLIFIIAPDLSSFDVRKGSSEGDIRVASSTHKSHLSGGTCGGW